MSNATHACDYDYAIDVIEYTMHEDVRPSLKFYDILSTFKYFRVKALRDEPNEAEQIKCNALLAIFKRWKKQMGLYGMAHQEIIKSLNVHPWKQLKEAENNGIESLKNVRTRRLWKRQHTLKTMTPNRLNNLQSDHLKFIDCSDNSAEIDEK